jgi:hypothetical protein
MSGRAALGGPREIALACLMVGRLVVDARQSAASLSAEQRKSRAAGAKHWLGSAALPTPVRTALARLAEATAGDQAHTIQAALEAVTTVTANHLEPTARLEWSKLAQAIAE